MYFSGFKSCFCLLLDPLIDSNIILNKPSAVQTNIVAFKLSLRTALKLQLVIELQYWLPNHPMTKTRERPTSDNKQELRNDKKLIEVEAKCCAVTNRGYLKD